MVVEVRNQVARKVHDFAGVSLLFDIGLERIEMGWVVEQKKEYALPGLV